MALIPIDVALGGINSIRGLIGANEADRERRRQLEQAAAQRRMAIDMLAKRSQDAFDAFQRWEQSFNPQATLNQIGQASAENLGTVLKNLNVGPMGEYRKDDTPRVMAARVATTEGLLKEQAARLAAQQQFENERYARLSDVNQRRFEEAQGRGNFATEFAREGMAMPGNNLDTFMQNLIGGGFAKRLEEQYFKKPKSETTGTTTGTTSRQVWDEKYPTPGSMAESLEQLKNFKIGYQGKPAIQLSGLGYNLYNPFGKKD